MNNNIRIFCVIALALAGTGSFADVFRDAMGRNQGMKTLRFSAIIL